MQLHFIKLTVAAAAGYAFPIPVKIDCAVGFFSVLMSLKKYSFDGYSVAGVRWVGHGSIKK